MGWTWQYYDIVLLAILVSLVAGVVVGLMTALPVAATVPVSGLVALGVVFHGLFVNGPVDRPRDLANEVEPLD